MKDKQLEQVKMKMKYWNRLNKKLHESGNPEVWIREFYSIADELLQSQRQQDYEEIMRMIDGMKKTIVEPKDFMDTMKVGDAIKNRGYNKAIYDLKSKLKQWREKWNR